MIGVLQVPVVERPELVNAVDRVDPQWMKMPSLASLNQRIFSRGVGGTLAERGGADEQQRADDQAE